MQRRRHRRAIFLRRTEIYKRLSCVITALSCLYFTIHVRYFNDMRVNENVFTAHIGRRSPPLVEPVGKNCSHRTERGALREGGATVCRRWLPLAALTCRGPRLDVTQRDGARVCHSGIPPATDRTTPSCIYTHTRAA